MSTRSLGSRLRKIEAALAARQPRDEDFLRIEDLNLPFAVRLALLEAMEQMQPDGARPGSASTFSLDELPLPVDLHAQLHDALAHGTWRGTWQPREAQDTRPCGLQEMPWPETSARESTPPQPQPASSEREAAPAAVATTSVAVRDEPLDLGLPGGKVRDRRMGGVPERLWKPLAF